MFGPYDEGIEMLASVRPILVDPGRAANVREEDRPKKWARMGP